MLVGENGIITQAQRADELTTQAQQKEAIELAVASVQAQGTLELDRTKLDTALQSQLGDTAYTLTENRDGSFLLQIAERSYYIDSAGEVITQENMIAIGSAEELKAFRDDVNSGNSYEGKYIYLTGNITLNSSEQWEPIGLYPNDSPTPDDESNKPFSGIFDGKGYEVNGIYINTTNKVQGLFGLVKSGKITSLGVGENNTITGGIGTAGVVGYAYNGTIVCNCYNKANIIGGNYNIGGVVGIAYTNCKIVSVYNTANIVSTNQRIGGIVGTTENNIYIEKCYNTGEINGTSYIGGIAGYLDNSSINQCYNRGKIIASENNVGGIVGKSYNNAKLINSYNIGLIETTAERVGGVIGYNQDSQVLNCYNVGNVNSNVANYIGGIIGQSTGNILVEHNYFLENVVNNSDGNSMNGVEAKTAEELKEIYNILGESWKEDNEGINNGYPILNWQ